MSAVRGFSQEANTEAKAAVVEKNSGKTAKDDQYLRIKKSDQGKPEALQTAIVRYVGKKGTKNAGKIVDLVGVVHIGQLEYYEDLNKKLAKYDSVLYELVAPRRDAYQACGSEKESIGDRLHANWHERHVES